MAQENTCPVCLMEIMEHESVTPCNHRFHTQCLLQSVVRSGHNCPCCRQALITRTHSVTRPPRSMYMGLDETPPHPNITMRPQRLTRQNTADNNYTPFPPPDFDGDELSVYSPRNVYDTPPPPFPNLDEVANDDGGRMTLDELMDDDGPLNSAVGSAGLRLLRQTFQPPLPSSSRPEEEPSEEEKEGDDDDSPMNSVPSSQTRQTTPPPPIEHIIRKLEEQGVDITKMVRAALLDHPEYREHEDEFRDDSDDVFGKICAIIRDYSLPI